MKSGFFKRSDIILICSIILTAVIILSILAIIFIGKGQTVVVKVDGEEYARLPLNEDTTLNITSAHGENLLIVKNGDAYVESASCPQQICVNSGKLSELNPIVCKHNHVSITLE